MLPADQAEVFLQNWMEFEEDVSNEAKFPKSMDRLEPILQNTSNEEGTWKEFDVKYQTVCTKKKVIKEASTKLWNYAEKLLEESVSKEILEK